MTYNLFPAVNETYDFPPEVRAALAKSTELRNTIVPMTTTLRNNLTAPELWDGRVIANVTTDHLEYYDLGTASWVQIAKLDEVVGNTGTQSIAGNLTINDNSLVISSPNDTSEPAIIFKANTFTRWAWKIITSSRDLALNRYNSSGAFQGEEARFYAATGILNLRVPHSVNSVQQGVYQDYTPTVTGVATSSATGRYCRIGNHIHFKVIIVVSAAPTGEVTVTYPVNSTASDSMLANARLTLGSHYNGVAFYNNTTTMLVRYINSSGVFSSLGASVPAAWSSGHKITIDGKYEV